MNLEGAEAGGTAVGVVAGVAAAGAGVTDIAGAGAEDGACVAGAS